jgi:hypothetical protein
MFVCALGITAYVLPFFFVGGLILINPGFYTDTLALIVPACMFGLQLLKEKSPISPFSHDLDKQIRPACHKSSFIPKFIV